MYVRVGKARKRGEGGSKLVLAQKCLEGLCKLSKFQHFSEQKFGPRRGRERDFPKATMETHRCPYPACAPCAALHVCQAGPQHRGPNLPQPSHSLLRRGPRSAWGKQLLLPQTLARSSSARCLEATPTLCGPGFRRICSKTICFKNPVKRARVPSLSPTRSGSGAQQPRP